MHAIIRHYGSGITAENRPDAGCTSIPRSTVLAHPGSINLLLNCMLLAATERSVTGDPITANYHFMAGFGNSIHAIKLSSNPRQASGDDWRWWGH